ncbi:hypothetical protein A8139_00765 [Marinomonas primoryensis]|uniref:Uncharacterized protein n=1 Tax=Marinomonas primoryensis TaxID=178399 RepID=A0A2Z4PMK6_9GAMM|nr:hypothetical protein [Marinomonas primoryensis]AWX98552.1 hypothetical protein A8139_00040 [Marinomonas primoryensis]AWX98684.1 hypothetical protein A8139_00765 [Marinomonas primoryensis]
MKYEFQAIQNGLVVTHEDNTTVYYATLDAAILGIAEPLKKHYKESIANEWDGAFTISLSASGLAV